MNSFDGLVSLPRDLTEHLAAKWLLLRGCSAPECVRIYLTVARKWPLFGAKLFSAKVGLGLATLWLEVALRNRSGAAEVERDRIYCLSCSQPVPPSTVEQNQVWLAVNEDGLCVLDYAMVCLAKGAVYRKRRHRSRLP